MNLNQRLTATVAFVSIVPLTLALAACDQRGEHGDFSVGLVATTPTLPSPLSATTIMPRLLPLIPTLGFQCPVSAPFTTDFDLIVDHRGRVDVFLNQVSLRFVDGSGFGASPLLFSPRELSTLFGQTLVHPFTSRAFNFRPQFGCGLSVPRSLVVQVFLIDTFGALGQTSLTMPIR
jgi:hypothetical protein